MVWYPPKTWSNGEIVAAQSLNEQIVENLTHLLEQNFAWLGTAGAPFTPPTSWKAIRLNRAMSATTNAFNNLGYFTNGTHVMAYICDTYHIREYDFVLQHPGVADTYVISPRSVVGTNHHTYCVLEAVFTSSSNDPVRLRIRQHRNLAGVGSRTIKVLLFVSAPPVLIDNDAIFTGSTNTNIYPFVGPGRLFDAYNVYTSSATSLSVFPCIERGETFELMGFIQASSTSSWELRPNGEGSSTGWIRQLLIADGTSVSASRSTNMNTLVTTATAEGVGFYYLGSLTNNGELVLTGSRTYNILNPFIVHQAVTKGGAYNPVYLLSLTGGTALSGSVFACIRHCRF
jgi:hypothetical protein